jgi:rhamnosyltransferase
MPSDPLARVTMPPEPLRVTAVLTAYHPDERLLAVVESALLDCARVIVADNTPAGSPSLSEKLADSRVLVIRTGRNLGLAGALNLAVSELPADAQAVLFLDQDSVLPDGLVRGLAPHLADPTIGIACPAVFDASSGTSYEMLPNRHETVSEQRTAITSGMLVSRAALDRVGGFREDFFVDWVDAEFCVRLRRTGARIVQDRTVALPHSIGDRREHRLFGRAVRVIHYPAWRHYWFARNGLILMCMTVRRDPLWTAAVTLGFAQWLVLTALFEPERRTHVPALLRGFRDGILRRTSVGYVPAGAVLRAADPAAV